MGRGLSRKSLTQKPLVTYFYQFHLTDCNLNNNLSLRFSISPKEFRSQFSNVITCHVSTMKTGVNLWVRHRRAPLRHTCLVHTPVRRTKYIMHLFALWHAFVTCLDTYQLLLVYIDRFNFAFTALLYKYLIVGQMRVGLAHWRLRTIKTNSKNKMSKNEQKLTFAVWETPLNI